MTTKEKNSLILANNRRTASEYRAMVSGMGVDRANRIDKSISPSIPGKPRKRSVYSCFGASERIAQVAGPRVLALDKLPNHALYSLGADGRKQILSFP